MQFKCTRGDVYIMFLVAEEFLIFVSLLFASLTCVE